MVNNKLIIDSLITIDDDGMPQAPNVRQLLDREVRNLYNRDKTKPTNKYGKNDLYFRNINLTLSSYI